MPLNLRRYFNFTELMNVVKRDWPSVLSALVAFGLTFVAIMQREWKLLPALEEDTLALWIASACMGISLFLSARLFTRSPAARAAYSFAALFAIVIFAWWHTGLGEIITFRILHFVLISHLLVATAPMVDFGHQTGEITDRQMWNFNWYLLTRVTFGLIFCGILTLGLMAALAAMRVLFNLKFAEEWFGVTAAFVFILISVFQILSTMANTRVSRQGEQITNDLRRLVQFLFTPLSVIYFVITYAYIAKIAIDMEWPKGRIGFLVSLLTVCVVLIYVLQKPLREVASFPEWMRKFWRWNFALLILPLIVLQLALWRRISDYGLTEERVALLYLSLWALAMAVYYIDPLKRRMWVIPVSLAVLLLATFAGPFSPHSLAFRSQRQQLNKLMERVGTPGPGGRTLWDPAKGTQEDNKRIKDSLRYFCRTFSPQDMFRAAGLSPEPVRNRSAYTECWEDAGRESYFSRVVDGLNLPTSNDYRSQRESYGVNTSGEFIFKAGGTEYGRFNTGFSRPGLGGEFGEGKLQFRYVCCEPTLEWLPDKQAIKIDLRPMLKNPNTPLVVKGGGGYLTIWLVHASAYGEDVHLRLQSYLQFDAVFSNEPSGAVRVSREKK